MCKNTKDMSGHIPMPKYGIIWEEREGGRNIDKE
jgi:hypothetical protein